MSEVKLSVVVLTYNHQDYIASAIESILAQKINFSMEVVIADDGSSDDTPVIVNQYVSLHPTVIRAVFSSENKGVTNNIHAFRKTLKGEYLAILDGDDYWDFEEKLQRQVDFLETNKEFNGIFHDARIVHFDQSNEVLFNHKYLYSQNYNFREILHTADVLKREIILPSSSAVLRMVEFKEEEYDLIRDNYSFLWKFCCLNIRNSRYYFVNEPWSVYRNHRKGISKSNNQAFHESHIAFLRMLLQDDYYKNCKYDVYSAISGEYKILLDNFAHHHAMGLKTKRAKAALLRKYFLKYALMTVKKEMQYYAVLKKTISRI